MDDVTNTEQQSEKNLVAVFACIMLLAGGMFVLCVAAVGLVVTEFVSGRQISFVHLSFVAVSALGVWYLTSATLDNFDPLTLGTAQTATFNLLAALSALPSLMTLGFLLSFAQLLIVLLMVLIGVISVGVEYSKQLRRLNIIAAFQRWSEVHSQRLSLILMIVFPALVFLLLSIWVWSSRVDTDRFWDGTAFVSIILLGHVLFRSCQLSFSFSQHTQLRVGTDTYSEGDNTYLKNAEAVGFSKIDSPHPNQHVFGEAFGFDSVLSTNNIILADEHDSAKIWQVEDINIGPGELVALSAYGATDLSFLTNFICGKHPPTSGQLRLTPNTEVLPSVVEYGGGSIVSHIIGDHSTFDAEAIVAAAQLSGVHNRIVELPQGYGTDLGPLETQDPTLPFLIALTSALYNPPELLILEPPEEYVAGHASEPFTATLSRLRGLDISIVVLTNDVRVLELVDWRFEATTI